MRRYVKMSLSKNVYDKNTHGKNVQVPKLSAYTWINVVKIYSKTVNADS